MNKKIISWILVIGIGLLPFLNSELLIDSGLLLHQLLISIIGIAISLVLFFNRKRLKTTSYYPVIFSLIFIGCYAVSSVDALNKSESWYWLTKISGYIILFIACKTAFENRMIRKGLVLKGVLFFSFISVLFFWIEVYIIKQHGVDLLHQKNLYQITTLYGNKNLYASVLIISLILIFPMVLKRNLFYKILTIVVIGAGLASIGFIQTKAVLMGMAAGAVVCLLPALNLIYKTNKAFAYALTSVAFIAIISFGWIVYSHPDKFYVLLNKDTFHERKMLWNNTWMMIRDFPLTGVGGGNWQIYFPKYGLEKFLTTNHMINDGFLTFQRPHNDFLWIWSEAGPFAFLIYLSLFIYGFIQLYRKFIRTNNWKRKLALIVLLFGWITYMVVAFFDFPLERAEHQFLFIIMAVLILNDKKKIKKTIAGSLWIGLVAIGITSCYVLSNRIKAEANTKQVIIGFKQSDWNKMLELYPYSVNAFYNLDNYSIPVSWYAGLAALANKDQGKAIGYFKEAYLVHPYQLHVLNNLASAYEVAGNHALAISFYDKALEITAKQPDVRLNRAAALYNSGKLKMAYEAIIDYPYDVENTQSHLYMKVILRDYLKSRLDSCDFKINQSLANTLVQYPDSILYYYLLFSENKSSFKDNLEVKHP